jgi:hypothetical protein
MASQVTEAALRLVASAAAHGLKLIAERRRMRS